VDLFDGSESRARNDGQHHLSLEGYGWRWYRVGGADRTLDRTTITTADHEVV
jgi:maltose alpha-D-glucosyltransferase / alpha-amylase